VLSEFQVGVTVEAVEFNLTVAAILLVSEGAWLNVTAIVLEEVAATEETLSCESSTGVVGVPESLTIEILIASSLFALPTVPASVASVL
jgi:hypothetical protein